MRNGPFPSSAGQGRSALSARPAVAVDGEERTATSKPSPSTPARFGGRILIALLAFASMLALAPSSASAQGEGKHVLIYTGTTGFRHTDGINNGRPAVQARLEALGFEVTWEDCTGFGTRAGQCRAPDENPRVFTDENLAQYDALYFLNVSDFFSGTGGTPGQLWNASEEAAIINFVQNGGGIAANHNATDMGAGQTPGIGGTRTTRTRRSARRCPATAPTTSMRRS